VPTRTAATRTTADRSAVTPTPASLPLRGPGKEILAAIDVGTNAARLQIAEVGADGALTTIHTERDPVRPGEGVFATGEIPDAVAERLVVTLRRYGQVAKRYKAHLRAVATAAFREAKNRDSVVERIRAEAGVELEVISGQEEARLIGLGVLRDRPKKGRTLILDIGGGSTEVLLAVDGEPTDLHSLALGAVRLTELFATSDEIDRRKLALLRGFARRIMAEGLDGRIPRPPRLALGSSGTVRSVVAFAASPGTAHASPTQLTRAVNALVTMPAAERRQRFEANRADIVVAGAVILEAFAQQLQLESVTAVEGGLRDGVLVDLWRREHRAPDDHLLTDAAMNVGRHFQFDEAHGSQVAMLATSLFDGLKPLHQLDAGDRQLLEVAALLHDVGHVVARHKHHKHTHYLIENAEFPTLSSHERALIALVARFHRRTVPRRNHPLLSTLPLADFNRVRRMATILRLADALDGSHETHVESLACRKGVDTVTITLRSRSGIELELWDAEHEAALFEQVFGRRLKLVVTKP